MSEDIVLIVDDNPVNLKLIKVLLSGEGYDLYTAVDAKETLALLQTIHPKLILMDIQLPDIDGLTLSRKIKADPKFKDIMIVAITAQAMKGDKEKTIAAGCDGYISKPIDTQIFTKTVADYLAKAPEKIEIE